MLGHAFFMFFSWVCAGSWNCNVYGFSFWNNISHYHFRGFSSSLFLPCWDLSHIFVRYFTIFCMLSVFFSIFCLFCALSGFFFEIYAFHQLALQQCHICLYRLCFQSHNFHSLSLYSLQFSFIFLYCVISFPILI